MHPAIQQRIDVLAALRERSNMATADFYQLANKIRPTRAPRFQVVPSGRGLFIVAERASGKVKGWRREHLEACALAKALELGVRA